MNDNYEKLKDSIASLFINEKDIGSHYTGNTTLHYFNINEKTRVYFKVAPFARKIQGVLLHSDDICKRISIDHYLNRQEQREFSIVCFKNLYESNLGFKAEMNNLYNEPCRTVDELIEALEL